jgi:hypothetical protein
MGEVVGACVSQFHDDANRFELLLAFSDGREVGHSVSRAALEKIANELVQEVGHAAKDAEIARQATVIEKYREAQQAEWQPIHSCPYREPVDLWCVYGGEEFAQFDGGASIGFLKSNRHRTEEYGFFGNQSKDGVPRRDGPDLVPVAWRKAVPSCPAALIAEVLGVPLTREDAIAALEAQADV